MSTSDRCPVHIWPKSNLHPTKQMCTHLRTHPQAARQLDLRFLSPTVLASCQNSWNVNKWLFWSIIAVLVLARCQQASAFEWLFQISLPGLRPEIRCWQNKLTDSPEEGTDRYYRYYRYYRYGHSRVRKLLSCVFSLVADAVAESITNDRFP